MYLCFNFLFNEISKIILCSKFIYNRKSINLNSINKKLLINKQDYLILLNLYSYAGLYSRSSSNKNVISRTSGLS